MALLDTPLNKAGFLQIYIRTARGQVIEINPQIRIPRTFKRFSGLMAQLLTQQRVMADTKDTFLMRVIPSLVLPRSTKIISIENKGKLVRLRRFIEDDIALKDDSVVFFITASSIAETNYDEIKADERISISNYPLSS